MQVFWEKIGILGPVYRLVARGLSAIEIASNLDITEGRVRDYVAWMQRFLHRDDRNELMRDALHSRVM